MKNTNLKHFVDWKEQEKKVHSQVNLRNKYIGVKRIKMEKGAIYGPLLISAFFVYLFLCNQDSPSQKAAKIYN